MPDNSKHLTLNDWRGGQFDRPCGFLKNVSFKERVKPETFLRGVLAIFIDFHHFLTFPCYKETNDVTLKQMM